MFVYWKRLTGTCSVLFCVSVGLYVNLLPIQIYFFFSNNHTACLQVSKNGLNEVVTRSNVCNDSVYQCLCVSSSWKKLKVFEFQVKMGVGFNLMRTQNKFGTHVSFKDMMSLLFFVHSVGNKVVFRSLTPWTETVLRRSRSTAYYSLFLCSHRFSLFFCINYEIVKWMKLKDL